MERSIWKCVVFGLGIAISGCGSSGQQANNPPIDASIPAADTKITADPGTTCQPSCANNVCGSDGCGGSCGDCIDPCTGAVSAGLCQSGQCISSCSSVTVNVTYTEDVGYQAITAYLFESGGCPEPGPVNPSLAANKAGPEQGQPKSFDLGPAKPGSGRAVAIVATGGDTGFAFGCTDGVVVQGEITTVEVTVTGEATSFEGVWNVESTWLFGSSLPPSIGSVVAALEEMNDDHDLNNDDPANNQYGEDPAAFLLDLIVRQGCCWEALGPDATFDSCSEQEFTHPIGDLSAIYLNDFSTWEGAQPKVNLACGAMAFGIGAILQDELGQVIQEELPALGTMLTTLPDDLSDALRNMKITSKITISNEIGGVANFSHTLVSVRFLFHDLQGNPHSFDANLTAAGLKNLTQSGKAVIDGAMIELGAHQYELDFGKLLSYAYHKGLLPVLGYTSTKAMLDTLVDCAVIAAKLEDKVPDLDFLDADDYEDFCNDGIEEAAKFLESTVTEAIASKAQIELIGTAETGDTSGTGTLINLANGHWQGTWKEKGQSGNFDGAFKASH